MKLFADERTPLQHEWDGWMQEYGGKLCADADGAYAEMVLRHSLRNEEEYHRPLFGRGYGGDNKVRRTFKNGL